MTSAWACAAKFPPNKEDLYPLHTVAQEFDLHRGKRILEYGCGGGSDALSYLRRGCAVDYVDVVAENVAAASERIHEAGLQRKAMGRVLLQSARIAVDDGTFDVVSSHGVIHHISEPLPVLRELHRVLKPGGFVYVMLYTEALYERFLKLRRGASAAEFCRYTDGHPGYARPYTADQGAVLLSEAGFYSIVVTALYNRGDFRTFRGQKP